MCGQNFRARHAIVIIVRIEASRDPKLAEIVHTDSVVSLGLSSPERGQEQAGEDSDNADDDEEFDKGEGAGTWSVGTLER